MSIDAYPSGVSVLERTAKVIIGHQAVTLTLEAHAPGKDSKLDMRIYVLLPHHPPAYESVSVRDDHGLAPAIASEPSYANDDELVCTIVLGEYIHSFHERPHRLSWSHFNPDRQVYGLAGPRALFINASDERRRMHYTLHFEYDARMKRMHLAQLFVYSARAPVRPTRMSRLRRILTGCTHRDTLSPHAYA